MLKKYQLLIIKRYLKSFFTIFIALTLFFTGVDIASNIDKLPKSANLQILFAINRFLFFTSFTFILSLVFAMINTLISFIKDNELVVMYSLGASKKDLLKPFIILISLFIFIYWILNNFQTYVYANQTSENIKRYSQVSSYSKELFLKYEDNYIFIEKLNRFKKEGNNIIIYETNDQDLNKIIKAQKGIFQDDFWILKNVTIINKPKINNNIIDKKLTTTKKDYLKALKGFKPSIINSLYKNSSGLTLSDSIKALTILHDKGININSIKTNLYKILFFPLYGLFISIIIFFNIPIQRRGANLGLLSAQLYFVALLGWGIIFIMIRFANNAAIEPELGIVLPILLLGLFSSIYYRKRSTAF